MCIRWKIGDGCRTNVLEQTWVLDLPLSRRPTYVNCALLEDKQVDYLIAENGGWDAARIKECFGEELADYICNLPLDPTLNDQPELINAFSGMSIARMITSKSSQCNNAQFAWIWKICVAPKVQFFWWRLMWNGVPTMQWLKNRGLEHNHWCPWGCLLEETREHLITDCLKLKEVIDCLGSWGISIPRFTTWHDGVHYISSPQNTKLPTVAAFCSCIYELWRARNHMIHRKPFLSPIAIASFGMSCLSSFSCSFIKEQWCSLRLTRQPSNSSWHTPPPGWLKINFDGALFPNYAGGIGMVVRDDKGCCLKLGGSAITHWDAGTVELKAFQSIFSLLEDWMFEMEGVIVEGDNYNVLKFLHKCHKSHSWSNNIELSFIFDLLLKFKCLLFSHVTRDSNRVANFCAHWAADRKFSFIWDSIPSDIPSLSDLCKEEEWSLDAT